jgi:hypothetical protein
MHSASARGVDFLSGLTQCRKLCARALAGGGELIPVAKPILDGVQAGARQVTRGLGSELI